MTDSSFSSSQPGDIDRDEMNSMLFAQMILQQSQMAMMLMGKIPNPQTGENVHDLEAARMFIDQLEMIEVKTKGNLNADEARLLTQTLTTLRMAFVEAVESPAPEAEKTEPKPDEQKSEPEAKTSTAAEDESKKKFTKKY
jgi:hypothetical protein